jgi:ribA/ribD-fused uncharacterized protein
LEVDLFREELFFLSNFYPCQIVVDGIYFPTSEHLYQYLKADNADSRQLVLAQPTPSEAKKITASQAFTARPDWQAVKLSQMEFVLRHKFSHPELLAMLLATGDMELVEDNDWDDTYWGVCNGIGENNLGKLLMKIRAQAK